MIRKLQINPTKIDTNNPTADSDVKEKPTSLNLASMHLTLVNIYVTTVQTLHVFIEDQLPR